MDQEEKNNTPVEEKVEPKAEEVKSEVDNTEKVTTETTDETAVDDSVKDDRLPTEYDKLEVSTIDESFIDDVFKSDYIDLYKIEGLDVKDQARVFLLVLTDIYKGYSEVDYSVLRKSSLKCLKLSCDPEDNELHLPYKLIVIKDKNRMYFKFADQTKKNLLLFLILLGLFIFFAMGSAYVALRYLSIAHLNIDLDGDGIADLNIDMNADDKEEINISKDLKKPNVNIDYKGNRKATFNVDTTGDGEADSNLINIDTDGDGVCNLNCDTDDDGWPDINVDIDGDGIADFYKDVDGDKTPDLNFDTNGDGVCDLHCDIDNDDVCDEYCVANLEVIDNYGDSVAVGNSGAAIDTATFIVDFVDSSQIKAENLFPDDQNDDATLSSVTKTMYVENKSSVYTRYKIELVISNNTFTSENFMYNIVSTNGGLNKDFTTTPKETAIIADNILIAPKSRQDYKLTFKLKGINAKQNFDQGRAFAGYLQVYIIESR